MGATGRAISARRAGFGRLVSMVVMLSSLSSLFIIHPLPFPPPSLSPSTRLSTMPTPTVGDLYARQLFSFPVPVVQKLVLHATEPESVLKVRVSPPSLPPSSSTCHFQPALSGSTLACTSSPIYSSLCPAQDLDSLFSGSSSSMSFDTPLITLVLLLVRHRLPDSPTPALDYAWATKGSNASRQDMEVFWERERRSPGAGQATLGVKAAGGEGEGLGPSPLPKRYVCRPPPFPTSWSECNRSSI